nr:kinase binding protein-like protein [Colletotrichum truncatum]KAF6785904.1 kinase binding protein-like protein [Colletotrichum truncatum]
MGRSCGIRVYFISSFFLFLFPFFYPAIVLSATSTTKFSILRSANPVPLHTLPVPSLRSFSTSPCRRSAIMSIIETIPIDHVPADHTVHIAFFKDIQNAGFLHSQLLARNAEFEYALIDASVAVSRTHILAAAFKAVTAKVDGSLKTPNVHSELVASLSSANNIAEAYRRYGISPSSKDVIAVKIVSPSPAGSKSLLAEDVEKHLNENFQGTPVPFTDESIATSTDWAKVRKYYKLNGLPWLDAIKDEAERKEQLETLVLGAMALRTA